MMLIRIIIMLLIALFVESRQEAFGQTTDTLSLSDKVIRTASFATGFRGEIWQNPALYYYYTPYIWTRLDVNGAYHDKGKASLKQEGDNDTRKMLWMIVLWKPARCTVISNIWQMC